MWAKLRLWILNTALPFTKVMGQLHMPFTHRRMSHRHYYDLESRIKPGTVLVTRCRGELSNLFIPGEFTHAAIYGGEQAVFFGGRRLMVPIVFEAIGEGVVATPLASFVLTKDRIMALEPKFCDQAGMDAAVKAALGHIGLPYDFLFSNDHKAFYCSELVFRSYREAVGDQMKFVEREILGIATIAPADFVNAKDHWTVAWDSDVAAVAELTLA